MITPYASTAQLKNSTLGKEKGAWVGVKFAFGEMFYVFEGKANDSQYLGLVRESDLTNGVI